MAKSYTNPAKFSSAFNVEFTGPIDDRFVVDSTTELINGSIKYPYIGLIVNIKGTDNLYVLSGSDATKIDNWKKIGADKADDFTIGNGLSWGGINNRELRLDLDTTLFVMVSGSTLPTKPETGKENKIHILQNADDGSGQNIYNEYLYVNGKWELLGSVRSNVDISQYYTKTQVNSIKSELEGKITTETNNRSSADTTLTNNLNKEIQDRESAITTVTDMLSDLESKLDTKVFELQTGIDNVAVPSLKVGTVSEGSAAASITGTTPNYTLNLTVPRGYQGVQGSKGFQGNQGNQGKQGNQGVQGSKGTDGTNGSQGKQGNQGVQGSKGTDGVKGSQGVQGSKGTDGTNGSQGVQGAKGDVASLSNVITHTDYVVSEGYQWTSYQDFKGGAGNSSDIRFKTNIEPLVNVLDKVLKMDIFAYTWEKDGDPKYDTFGVSAQQLEEFGGNYKKIVHIAEDTYNTRSVEYSKLGVLAIRAIQELAERVAILEAKLNV